MTDQGYQDWRRFHCCLLCIQDSEPVSVFEKRKAKNATAERKTTEYGDLLDELQPLFRRMQFTIEELDAGSVWMIEDPERAESKWRCHYGMITQFILRRREARKRFMEQEARVRLAQQFKDKPIDFAAMRAALMKSTTIPEE